MKKIFSLLIIVILSLSLCACSNNNLHHVKISVKDYGDIVVELDSNVAPITVDNFIALVKDGFYDGLTFHRIINLKHTRGVISMARANSYDSASSQFFIVQKDSSHLDGLYASFGHVTSGMDIVDKIATNTKVEDSNGTVLKENQPVISKITFID